MRRVTTVVRRVLTAPQALGVAGVLGALLCSAPALAQTPEPVGPFVVDIHGVTGGLPTSEGWTPLLPTGSEVPARGLGFETGAHVYLGGDGAIRFGVGAAYGTVRGKSTPADPETPEVTTRSTSFSPQVSLNFGRKLGWSYLSGGYGWVKILSESTAVGEVLAASEDSGWVGAINFGGGARWFLTEHVGVGFDARWQRLPARDLTTTTLAAPRATLFSLAFGVSIR